MKSKHLQQINESYLTHAGHALWIAGQLCVTVPALLIHALLPDLFQHTASNRLAAIDAYRKNRERKKEWESMPGVIIARLARKNGGIVWTKKFRR